jgi:phenylacetic acid degradation operon negative regulatory protein
MAAIRNAETERPLSARSLILSLLLRTRPPRMRGARLVQWCGLFGVAEGTARVALSRMVDRGELRTAEGTYALAGRVERRRPAQDWSIEPELRPWDGTWTLAVVTGGARPAADRHALRDAMRRLRMAELRESLWARPANLPRAAAPADAWDVAEAQCAWWAGEPAGDPAALAARLFAPARWAVEAERLAGRLARVTDRLGAAPDTQLAAAFRAGATALAHLRADPLLPVELAPDSEAGGDALRAAYGRYEARFSEALRAWFRGQA